MICNHITLASCNAAAADLDEYLKGNQVRFSEVFATFDTDRSGSLEGGEVRQLVKRLLPATTEHELRYLWVRRWRDAGLFQSIDHHLKGMHTADDVLDSRNPTPSYLHNRLQRKHPTADTNQNL